MTEPDLLSNVPYSRTLPLAGPAILAPMPELLAALDASRSVSPT
jgi:hypothetical protein